MSKSTKRIAVIGVIGVIAAGLVYFSGELFSRKPIDQPGMKKLYTGGTSVVNFIMERWKQGCFKGSKVIVEFQAKGSKDGIDNMISKKYDIGFSHAPLSPEQMSLAKSKGGDVIQIPVGISAIVPIYNVEKLKDKERLTFTGEVLGKIFLGEIKKWNDDELKKLNPELKDILPDAPINVVHRADGSGSTQVFTEYLLDASKSWRESGLGQGDTISWKVGKGVARSKQLAQYVSTTEGSIGYVELVFAKLMHLQFGAVRNQAGKDIQVKPVNITAAAAQAAKNLPEDLTFKLTNLPGDDSYPICAAAWAICYQNQPADKQKMVTDFLTWITHEGQKQEVNIWTHEAQYHVKKFIPTAFVAKEVGMPLRSATIISQLGGNPFAQGPSLAASTWIAGKMDGAVTRISLVEDHAKVKPDQAAPNVGYQTAPNVKIEGGGGKGAEAKATIAAGKITSITVISGGSGYTSAPTVTVDPAPVELLFAPLPPELVERVTQRIQLIKSVQ